LERFLDLIMVDGIICGEAEGPDVGDEGVEGLGLGRVAERMVAAGDGDEGCGVERGAVAGETAASRESVVQTGAHAGWEGGQLLRAGGDEEEGGEDG